LKGSPEYPGRGSVGNVLQDSYKKLRLGSLSIVEVLPLDNFPVVREIVKVFLFLRVVEKVPERSQIE